MRDAAKFLFVLVCMMILLAPLSPVQSWREQRQQPEKLMDIAGIEPGMIVGEAGAGDGFLTFFISRRIGDEGHVYANDIDKNALRRLNERGAREGVKNITTVLGEVADPCFPVKDLDVVTMIYAFHDFTEKAAWLVNVKKYLKKDAAIYIFDAQDYHTGMSKEAVEKLGEEAGFQLTRCEKIHGGLWIYVLDIKERN
jgi:ubiquinone/menaquinone biosynthesis C-methylase UbiE